MGITIEIECSSCGGDLAEQRSARQNTYTFEPCGDCMKTTQSEAFDEGYQNGKSDGHDIGYTEGYEAGQASIRDDVREMLKTVGEEIDCDALKAGEIHTPAL